MERVTGIEPVSSGRKHDILPLNYTRISSGADEGNRTLVLTLGRLHSTIKLHLLIIILLYQIPI